MPTYVENPLLDSLITLVVSAADVVYQVIQLVIPWLPLIAWVAFWLLAVNWKNFREVLVNGGVIGVLLIGLCMILIWGLIAPPDDGAHYLFGLTLSNFVGKTVYVTALFCIMFLCGSVQLSGCCSSLCCFGDDEEPAEEAAHAAH